MMLENRPCLEVHRMQLQDRRRVSTRAVSDVAAFLASAAASGGTGPISHIDGGRHVRC